MDNVSRNRYLDSRPGPVPMGRGQKRPDPGRRPPPPPWRVIDVTSTETIAQVAFGAPSGEKAIENVSDLDVSYRDSKLMARWTWPAGIKSAIVSISSEDYAMTEESSNCKHIECWQSAYEQQNGCPLPKLPGERLFVCVFARKRVGDEWRFASGYTLGARRAIAIEKCCTLYYETVAGEQLIDKSHNALCLRANTDVSLPALRLVLKSDIAPLSKQDGDFSFSIESGYSCPPDYNVFIEFPNYDLPRNWRARLFPEDDDDADWLTIVETLKRCDLR